MEETVKPSQETHAPEVLVVDDNPATRYATARVLRAAGFKTREAELGAEALRLADNSVAAVILDVHLPDMSGFEVCRTLRSRHETVQIPVIHLSAAYVDNQDKVRGLNYGADAYMTHPADPDLLVATLNSLIRARTAEEGMRRSEARFRAIYDYAPNGICLLDAHGAFVDVNPAMLDLLKRSRNEVVGRRAIDFAPPEWADRFKAYLDKTQQGVWRGEFPVLDANGQLIHLEWSLSAHVEPGVSMAIVNNISERVALSRQREALLEREQAARAASERLSRSKDEFAAVLSHELRAPLNAITLWVELLKKGNASNLPRGLEVIERNVKAQARLISDLLDVSRMAMGKLSLSFETVDPVELVRTAVDSLRNSAAEKSLDLSLALPDHAQPMIADPTRFQQIVWNLLTNAIKFSRPGGRIRVQLAQDTDGITLVVQDEGAGIRPDFLPYLFGTFSQSDSVTSRKSEGLGLGLSIVRQLAELHGGSVEAASEGLDRGATFTVRMPLRPPLAAETGLGVDQPDDPAMQVVIPPKSLAGMAIMVVDDDGEALAMLSMILRDRGARVIGTKSYAEALRGLQEAAPDLLVSDIGLPGRDGYELIREVRRREGSSGRRIPAIALTAFARPEDRRIALAAGFDAHCAKPLNPNELMAAIVAIGPRAGD